VRNVKSENDVIRMPFFHRIAFSLAWRGVRGSQYYWAILGRIQQAKNSQNYQLENGFPIEYDSDDWTSRTIYQGTYERPLLKFLNQLDCQSHVIDVGANIGVTLWHGMQKSASGSYWAFEPASEPYRKLSMLCSYLPNTGIAFREALGRSEGKAKLFGVNNSKHSGLATLRPMSNNQNLDFEEVSVTTLDQVVGNIEIQGAVNLLKIDVEGLEPEVLSGSKMLILSGRVEVIIIEVSPELVDLDYLLDIYEWTKAGYDWFELYEKGSLVRKVQVKKVEFGDALSSTKQWNLIIVKKDLELKSIK